MTSPLERAILTHYWTTPEPYRNGSENWTPLEAQTVARFLNLGLLKNHKNGGLIANTDALRIYMDALATVPLPVLRWVIPSDPTKAEP